jgi:hypothetical protein
MTLSRDRIADQALECHTVDTLEFGHAGPAVLGVGKEALLSRLTTRRSQEHQAAIDYIFRHAQERNAYVYTTTHVLAEVIGTIRSGTDQHTVNDFWGNIQESSIAILEDGRSWTDSPSDDEHSPFRSSFEQFRYLQKLYDENPEIDFKFHEGTLVLNGILLEERASDARTVYIATFDGALASLADIYEIDVLPYVTPLRKDTNRSL